jgi:hypothetical protein
MTAPIPVIHYQYLSRCFLIRHSYREKRPSREQACREARLIAGETFFRDFPSLIYDYTNRNENDVSMNLLRKRTRLKSNGLISLLSCRVPRFHWNILLYS